MEGAAMSATEKPQPRALPPLVAGQRLDRATFHERYEAMPPGTRAELIGGIVYMPSPLGIEHGERDGEVSDWLGHYKRFTKGIRRALNATTQFDDYGEPQPDLLLLIREELGGQTRIVDGYVVGAPELVVEIAKTTRKTDLGPKKADYERAGVLEYIFIGLDPEEVRWFVRREGKFVETAPGPDGIYRSEVFHGLWFDPQAFFARDMDSLIATLDRGLATPEHAAFVARLAAAAGGPN
jgi:Uma2 family endonuclease